MDAASFSRFIAETAESAVSGSDAVTIAIFTMVSALGVALINSIFSFVTQKYGAGKTTQSRAQKLVAKQAEAFELFIVLQGFDPRKIKTGYESPEEVRRVDA